MNRGMMNTLVIAGSALAGGAAGTWLGAKAGATYGLRLGPWAGVAGAVIGALAGTALSDAMQDELEQAMEAVSEETSSGPAPLLCIPAGAHAMDLSVCAVLHRTPCMLRGEESGPSAMAPRTGSVSRRSAYPGWPPEFRTESHRPTQPSLY